MIFIRASAAIVGIATLTVNTVAIVKVFACIIVCITFAFCNKWRLRSRLPLIQRFKLFPVITIQIDIIVIFQLGAIQALIIVVV